LAGNYLRPIPLYRITWKHVTVAPGSDWDGTIGEMLFAARYSHAQGWQVRVNAC
jgi:hypothetical protein